MNGTMTRRDLSGHTVNGIAVHSVAYKRGNNWYWNVTCKCGRPKIKSSISIDRGQGCNHCAPSGGCVLVHPESGQSFHVQRNYQDITGQTINGKQVIGPVRRAGSRLYYDVVCRCGHRFEALKSTLGVSSGCRKCAHKGDRPHRRLRPHESQYNNFKTRAKHPVSLAYEDYYEIAKSNPPCHYCNAALSWPEYRHGGRGTSGASNLDRKDSSRGYDSDNVVPCCGRCNYAKGTHFTYDEWVEVGRLIKSWHSEREYLVTPQSGRAAALAQLEIENAN